MYVAISPNLANFQGREVFVIASKFVILNILFSVFPDTDFANRLKRFADKENRPVGQFENQLAQ
jgi:hypothetical protein